MAVTPPLRTVDTGAGFRHPLYQVMLETPGLTVGTAVLDDFWFDPGIPDARREAWLQHPLLTTIELWVTPGRRALVAVRR